jgi:hypothetical protein
LIAGSNKKYEVSFAVKPQNDLSIVFLIFIIHGAAKGHGGFHKEVPTPVRLNYYLSDKGSSA